MKLIKVLILALTLFASSVLYGQQVKNVTGLLVLSVERNDESFDLFFPCTVDSLKTLEDNIKFVKKGIATQINVLNSSNYEQLIYKAETLRNEVVGEEFAERAKYQLVIPIVAELDLKIEERLGQKSKRQPFVAQFYGNTLFENYQTKLVFLKSSRIIPCLY